MSAKTRVIHIPYYGRAEVFQWRIVNHEEAKEFLGECYIAVISKHNIISRDIAANLAFIERRGDPSGGGVSKYARPGDYIVKTESGRFVPVDEEVWEAIAR